MHHLDNLLLDYLLFDQLVHKLAPIYMELMTGYKTSFMGSQKCNNVGNFFWSTNALEWNLLFLCMPLL